MRSGGVLGWILQTSHWKYMGLSWNRATPSHHPLLDGMFHEINHPFFGGGSPLMESPICKHWRVQIPLKIPSGNQTWQWKIPYQWRFLARKITYFYGPFSSKRVYVKIDVFPPYQGCGFYFGFTFRDHSGGQNGVLMGNVCLKFCGEIFMGVPAWFWGSWDMFLLPQSQRNPIKDSIASDGNTTMQLLLITKLLPIILGWIAHPPFWCWWYVSSQTMKVNTLYFLTSRSSLVIVSLMTFSNCLIQTKESLPPLNIP